MKPFLTNPRNIMSIFVGTFVYVLVYYIIALTKEPGSAILFIGLPFLSSFLVAMTAERDSAKITYACSVSFAINLLFSVFFLGEGFICVLMALPIFMVMAVFGACLAGSMRLVTIWATRKKPSALIILIPIPLLLGYIVWDVRELQSGAPIVAVRNELIMDGTREEIWKRITFDDRPKATVPTWIRLWVAQPQRFAFAGQGIGAERFVDFGEPHYGDDHDAIRNKLVYKISECREQEFCVFACAENHTRMRMWLDLLETRIEFSEGESPGKTRISLTTQYRRRLGPAIYFKPLFNLAISNMNGMLLEELALRK